MRVNDLSSAVSTLGTRVIDQGSCGLDADHLAISRGSRRSVLCSDGEVRAGDIGIDGNQEDQIMALAKLHTTDRRSASPRRLVNGHSTDYSVRHQTENTFKEEN